MKFQYATTSGAAAWTTNDPKERSQGDDPVPPVGDDWELINTCAGGINGLGNHTSWRLYWTWRRPK